MKNERNMTEQISRIEAEPHGEDFPRYYCVLELDQENPPPSLLVIGRTEKYDPTWMPDIDLPGHLGLFKSTMAMRQGEINILNKSITVGEEASGKAYHNGKLLERGECVSIQDGDMVNIDDIQLFIRFVSSTGTGKPYYLYTICDRIPLYTQDADKPKTPWNPKGYTPDGTVVVNDLKQEVPLWLLKEAQKDAKTWDLDAMELLVTYLEAERVERVRAVGSSDKDQPSGFSERFQQLMKKIDDKHQEDKMRWLQHHSERKPVYPSTQEEGTFIGIFGFLVSAWSAREFPYYQTPSGVYFFEWVDDEGENKKVIQLDLEDMIEQQSVLFFSAESWLKHESLDLKKGKK